MLQAKIDRLANGKSILCKSNTSKLPFLVDTNLGYLSLEGPGRRTANGWHQVNFRRTPEEFGEWRLKLAMCSRARNIFFFVGTRKLEKKYFFCKTLSTRKFTTGKLFEASTYGILTHSGFRKYGQFGWPSLRSEVIGAQSEVIGKISHVTENKRRNEKLTLFYFWSDH